LWYSWDKRVKIINWMHSEGMQKKRIGDIVAKLKSSAGIFVSIGFGRR
jgi:hypothetical protein